MSISMLGPDMTCAREFVTQVVAVQANTMQRDTDSQPKDWQISTPEAEDMDSKDLAKLIDWGIGYKFDSLLIVRHGRIVLEAYYAPYAAGILHAQYSVTKSVIGTLTAIAWKEGLLDSPTHRVLDYFDRPSIANPDPRKEAITVQNLLDMTSGLAWMESGFEGTSDSSVNAMVGSPDWVKFILNRPMSSAPGDIFNYDSGNPHLLSAILTKLTGISALDYAKAKLFGPLGIGEVSWVSDPQGISSGSFGLWLEPRDMAKIGYLYLRNGKWEGKQLLPPYGWIEKIKYATIDVHFPGVPEQRYSNLFWTLPDKHAYFASGSYGQTIMVFPDLDVVAVTTGRSRFSPSEFADLISGSVRSDAAIPAEPAGAEQLAKRISEVSTEKPTPVGAAPKTAASISGKVYGFPPNPLNVKSISLILTDPQPSYDAEIYTTDKTGSAPRLTGPIGLDGCYQKGVPTNIPSLGIRGAYAAKGIWLDDHTFLMNWLILGRGPAEVWTFTFDEDQLNVYVALPSGMTISLDGKPGG